MELQSVHDAYEKELKRVYEKHQIELDRIQQGHRNEIKEICAENSSKWVCPISHIPIIINKKIVKYL